MNYKKIVENVVSSGDVSGMPMPAAKALKRNLTEESVETKSTMNHTHYVGFEEKSIAEDGTAFLTTSPSKYDGHVHTILLISDEVKALKNNQEVKVETSVDTGHKHEIVWKSKKYLGENRMENIKMIEETDTYKFYQETNNNKNMKYVFELLDESDYMNFSRGWKTANPRFWRGTNGANMVMLERYNSLRGHDFLVRYKDMDIRPNFKRV